MNYGGPVWHVSVAPIGRFHVGLVGARHRALGVLDGVGDDALGHWEEEGGIAYHVRRRLTADEETMVGPVRDLRGLKEGQERLTRAWRYLPFTLRAKAVKELKGQEDDMSQQESVT